MPQFPSTEIPNETFLSLALQADQRPELSNFGKAVTVLLCFLSTALESGVSESALDKLMSEIKAGAIETAAIRIAETAHAPDS